MAGSLKTREYFLACRRDMGRVQALIETSRYKGMTILEVVENLGLTLSEREEAKLRELGYSLV